MEKIEEYEVSDKESVKKILDTFENHFLERLTYKYFTHSHKIYSSHEIARMMFGAIKSIAKKNHYTVSKNVTNMYSLIEGLDYYQTNKAMIDNQWYTEAYKQYSSIMTTYQVLKTLYTQVEDDLTLIDKGLLDGLLDRPSLMKIHDK